MKSNDNRVEWRKKQLVPLVEEAYVNQSIGLFAKYRDREMFSNEGTSRNDTRWSSNYSSQQEFSKFLSENMSRKQLNSSKANNQTPSTYQSAKHDSAMKNSYNNRDSSERWNDSKHQLSMKKHAYESQKQFTKPVDYNQERNNSCSYKASPFVSKNPVSKQSSSSEESIQKSVDINTYVKEQRKLIKKVSSGRHPPTISHLKHPKINYEIKEFKHQQSVAALERRTNSRTATEREEHSQSPNKLSNVHRSKLNLRNIISGMHSRVKVEKHEDRQGIAPVNILSTDTPDVAVVRDRRGIFQRHKTHFEMSATKQEGSPDILGIKDRMSSPNNLLQGFSRQQNKSMDAFTNKKGEVLTIGLDNDSPVFKKAPKKSNQRTASTRMTNQSLDVSKHDLMKKRMAYGKKPPVTPITKVKQESEVLLTDERSRASPSNRQGASPKPEVLERLARGIKPQVQKKEIQAITKRHLERFAKSPQTPSVKLQQAKERRERVKELDSVVLLLRRGFEQSYCLHRINN